MTLGELITEFRLVADDNEAPELWSRSEAISYANQAEQEAAIRGRLLRDDAATFCSIALSIGTSVVNYNAKIIHVLRAKLASMTRPLTKKTEQDLDLGWDGWETATGGTDYYIEQPKSRQIRLVCPVKVADTLKLTVYRLPLSDMTDTVNNSPEIAIQHHRNLVYWMLKLAYEKQDAETRDDERSQKFDDRFTSIFGPRPSEFQLEHWRTRAPARTRAQFI